MLLRHVAEPGGLDGGSRSLGTIRHVVEIEGDGPLALLDLVLVADVVAAALAEAADGT